MVLFLVLSWLWSVIVFSNPYISIGAPFHNSREIFFSSQSWFLSFKHYQISIFKQHNDIQRKEIVQAVHRCHQQQKTLIVDYKL